MAQETLISPGVLTRENDLTQITQGPVTAGLALVGPTVKGKPNVPTIVTSYSDFKNKFGGSFVSGGATYEYLTSITAYNYFQQGGSSILVTRVASGAYAPGTCSIYTSASVADMSFNTASVVFETLNVGTIVNNSGSQLSNGSLLSGSIDNVKVEVTSLNDAKGTFSFIVRRGDDNGNSKVILESFSNVSLDPTQPNFISAVVGDQTQTVAYDSSTGNYYLQLTGSYANASRYIRVKSVNKPTPNYFTNAGVASSTYSGSGAYLPGTQGGSGSNVGYFTGGTGEDTLTATNFYGDINTTTQGLVNANYATASNLLNNQDEYDFTLLSTPGLIKSKHTAVNDFISLAENRGDFFYIADLVTYGSTLNTATNTAGTIDSNYAGAYWPWIQVASPETGKLVWVPVSVVMPGVYAYNDQVSAEWFAPAGLTRGGLGGVLQAERKLSPTDRDTLYAASVNPIATFPNVGVTAYGQKTLQNNASALDRINVRRLLITLKRYVGNVARTLVFEQNTTVTRNRFLSQVTPYLESVQQKQGLYAFKVVMDETNNTADVIDRNQLVGQIYLQPTRTAEYILLDFNLTPTGATFGQ